MWYVVARIVKTIENKYNLLTDPVTESDSYSIQQIVWIICNAQTICGCNNAEQWMPSIAHAARQNSVIPHSIVTRRPTIVRHDGLQSVRPVCRSIVHLFVQCAAVCWCDAANVHAPSRFAGFQASTTYHNRRLSRQNAAHNITKQKSQNDKNV